MRVLRDDQVSIIRTSEGIDAHYEKTVMVAPKSFVLDLFAHLPSILVVNSVSYGQGLENNAMSLRSATNNSNWLLQLEHRHLK